MTERAECLFGLDKKVVSRFFEDTERRFTNELKELDAHIQSVSNENRQLEKEIRAVEERMSNEEKYNLILQAKTFMPLSISALERQTEDEIQKLYDEFSERNEMILRQCQQLEREIENGNKLLNRMVRQFESVIESLDESKSPLDEEEQEFNPVSSPPAVPQQSNGPHPSFWGDVDLSSSSKALLQTEKGLSDSNDSGRMKVEKGQSNGEPIPVPERAEEKRERTTEEGWEIGDGLPSAAGHGAEKNQAAKGQATAQEIDMIKKRYIVGKIAGANLYDLNGHLLVAEHTKITSDIVERASREGVLAELIIHMKIPEWGESET
ncbi:hypothetical protein [Priestia abyssalis]|uniref:hypothetical protein n=1 Tax=Priestia abyssalis TaxID=1221450 RepID=UPI00099575A2|nr:hypothetical protein [Priestia abyssalis]